MGTIEIKGDDVHVTATGQDRSTGIGTGGTGQWGQEGKGTSGINTINIDIGGTSSVTANGGAGNGTQDGTGIGLASDNYGSASISSINISTSVNSKVTATGGAGGRQRYWHWIYPYGIPNATGKSTIGKINISGTGEVVATGNGDYAAGIGTGYTYTAGGANISEINIDGNVTASGGLLWGRHRGRMHVFYFY